MLVAPSVDVYIRSEGCNDPQKTANTCGIAYIRVNGKDISLHIRGHNVVVLDEATGNIRCVADSVVFNQNKTGDVLIFQTSSVHISSLTQ